MVVRGQEYAVKFLGSKGASLSVAETSPGKMQVGEVYAALFEEHDDDGALVTGWDTAVVIQSGLKKPGTDKFYRAIRFSSTAKEFRYSELPQCKFYGPIRFEATAVVKEDK